MKLKINSGNSIIVERLMTIGVTLLWRAALKFIKLMKRSKPIDENELIIQLAK